MQYLARCHSSHPRWPGVEISSPHSLHLAQVPLAPLVVADPIIGGRDVINAVAGVRARMWDVSVLGPTISAASLSLSSFNAARREVQDRLSYLTIALHHFQFADFLYTTYRREEILWGYLFLSLTEVMSLLLTVECHCHWLRFLRG